MSAADPEPPGCDVLIVGGGHGGAQAAIALRQGGFAGSIAVVTDEQELPYERPPLSKDYLAGEKAFERLLVRPARFWEEREVAFLCGQRVSTVEPDRRRVVTDAGKVVGYRHLIWAAGGRPRRLSCPGADLEGLHMVRTSADVDRLIGELPEARRVVVVGGGYIGLEAAAVLTKLGKHVHVVEALDRVLARVAGEPLSRFFAAEHRAHGVEVTLGAVVECIEGANGRVTGVRLQGGEALPADIVIVGIGIEANVEPLLAAGAAGERGVLVDEQCRTSLRGVYAVGDCALHRNRYAGGALVRLESVQNATDQATVAAKAILGQPAAYDTVPWFWSNQYDIRLQTVGISAGHDDLVVRGDPDSRSFSIIYLREGRVIALDCVNATRDYVQGRKLLTGQPAPARERLADTSIPLKELAAGS